MLAEYQSEEQCGLVLIPDQMEAKEDLKQVRTEQTKIDASHTYEENKVTTNQHQKLLQTASDSENYRHSH